MGQRINNLENFQGHRYATENWVTSLIGGGNVISIGGLSGAVLLSTDFTKNGQTVSVNSGTTIGKFLKFTVDSQLPALDGSLLTTLNASNLFSGTVPNERLNNATITVKGIVQLATEAETTAGSLATKAVTPAGLKVELDKKMTMVAGTADTILAGDANGNVTRTTITSNFLTTFNGVNQLVKTGADGKILSGNLPDMAITNVYTVDASAEANLTKTIIELIQTVDKTTFNQGDTVVIVTSTIDRADVAGSFMFKETVAKANITGTEYVKLYQAAGTVVSVNGNLPISGNITLTLTDIVGSTLATVLGKLTDSANKLIYNNVTLASEAFVTNIIGSDDTTGLKLRIKTAEDATGIIQSKAVQFLEVVFQWVVGDRSGNGTDGYVFTKEIDGRVIQIFDADGWCFPQVSYNNVTNKSTIVVETGSLNSFAEVWTVVVSQLLNLPS